MNTEQELNQIEVFRIGALEELQRLLFLGGVASNGALMGVCVVSANNASSSLARYIGAHFRKLEKEFGVEILGVRYVRYTKRPEECFYTVQCGNTTSEIQIY